MRLFLGNGVDYFQLFSLEQRPDASIYFSAPLFEDIQWHVPSRTSDQKTALTSYQVGEPGKLSIHGSGLVHAKASKVAGSNQFAVQGHILGSRDGSVLSVRHLLTILPSEPQHKPRSAAGARKSDGWMTTPDWHPYVIVFWAVPLVRAFTVEVSGTFHRHELEELPPHGGWGAFNLRMHAVVWFAYRTRHMSKWPRQSQACYGDGYATPIFVGTAPRKLRIEYRRTKYDIAGDLVSIVI